MRLQRQATQGNSIEVNAESSTELWAAPETFESNTASAGPTGNSDGALSESLQRVHDIRFMFELRRQNSFFSVLHEPEDRFTAFELGLEESNAWRDAGDVTRRRFSTDIAHRPPTCAEGGPSSTECADSAEITSSCRSSFERDRSIDSSCGLFSATENEEFTQVKVIDTDDEREIAQKRSQVKELQRSGKRGWSSTTGDLFVEEHDNVAVATPPCPEKNSVFDIHLEGSALCTPHKRRFFRAGDDGLSESLHTINRKQLRPRATGPAARRLTVEVLTADIMQQVFRHLSLLPDLSLRAASVCKAWRIAALNPRLWQELDFEHFERVNNTVLLTYAQRAQGHLRLLDLSKCHQVSNTTIIRVVRENPRLHTIRLAWCTSVTDSVVTEIARCCRELKEIVLACCVNVTSAAIDALAEHCPSLTVLNIACIGKIEPNSLVRLFRRCPNLEQLHIVNSPLVDDRVVAQMARRLPRLKHLDLSWCCHVTDDALCRLARHCRDLEHVELGDTKVSSHGVRTLLRCCRRLTGLGLPRCIFVDDEIIHAILAFAIDRLESLNIASCNRISDDAVCLLLEQGTALQKLDVSKLPCRQLGNFLRRGNPRLEVFY
jgi:hypothetical protein